MSKQQQSYPKYRLDRVGNVVVDRRQPGSTVGTDAYREKDRLFAPRRSSPARDRFRAKTQRQAA